MSVGDRGILAFDHSDATALPVETRRLRLIPATTELVQARSHGRVALAKSLAVNVPETWPPKNVPDPDSPDGAAWWNWYFVRRPVGGTEALLIGFGGIKGWSSVARTVQMGCAFLDEHQAQGYSPEALEAMTAWAFSKSVDRVIIDVPSGHVPSMKVLAKIGYTAAGPGSDSTLTRYERRRI
jgi:RimJ/RimL family protein N-acetyltransferase